MTETRNTKFKRLIAMVLCVVTLLQLSGAVALAEPVENLPDDALMEDFVGDGFDYYDYSDADDSYGMLIIHTAEGFDAWRAPLEVDGETKHIYPAMINEIIIEYLITEVPALAFASIQEDGLQNFSNLERVVFFSESPLTVGYRAFYGAETLGFAEFEGYDAAVTFATNTSGVSEAFGNCPNLNYVNFNSNVPTGLSSAFSGTTNVTWISFNGTLDSIPEGAFAGLTSLQTVMFSGANLSNLTEIGDSAFEGCTNLETLDFSGANLSNLTKIGASAFEGCTNLETVDFSGADIWDITEIGERAFYGCESLTDVSDILYYVRVIGDYAFAGSGITGAYLEGITTIGDYAFQGCEDLSDVYIASYYYENTGTTVGKYAFADCTALEFVSFGWPQSQYPIIIDDYAFSGCTALDTLGLPWCEWWNAGYYHEKTVIGKEVFANTGLSGTVGIPYNVEFLYKNTFVGSTGITDFEFVGEPTEGDGEVEIAGKGSYWRGAYHTIYQGNVFLRDERGRIGELWEDLGVGAAPPDDDFYTPDTMVYLDEEITIIEQGTLEDTEDLEYLYIHAGVTVIGASAFSGFINLKSVTFAPDSQLVSIGENAFSGCTSLESVVFEGDAMLDTIDAGAFAYCTSLRSITIPASVEIIDAFAFGGCEKLKSVEIPEGSKLWFLGDGAFDGCVKLEEFAFSEKPGAYYDYTVLGGRVFGDSGIRKLTIPPNIVYSDAANSYTLLNTNVPMWSYVGDDGSAEAMWALYDLPYLREINVIQDEKYNNAMLASYDGVLFGAKLVAVNSDTETYGYISELGEIKPDDIEESRVLDNDETADWVPRPYLIQYPPAKNDYTTYDIAEAAAALQNEDIHAKLDVPLGELVDYTEGLVIGMNAFRNAMGVEHVIIPTSTEYLGAMAFGADIESGIKFIDYQDPENAKIRVVAQDDKSAFHHGGATNRTTPLTMFLPRSLTYNGGAPGESLSIGIEEFYEVSGGDSREYLRVSVYRGSDAHLWAIDNELAPFYRASGTAMAMNPPDAIYQYIPYRFTPSTSVLDNDGLVFSITQGTLPAGFGLVENAEQAQKLGMAPGTIFGTLYEDAATIAQKYGNSISLQMTAVDGHGSGFSAAVTFNFGIELAPGVEDAKFSVWPVNNSEDVDGVHDSVAQSGFFGLSPMQQAGIMQINRSDLPGSAAFRTMHINKKYGHFVAVYLNGLKLTEGAYVDGGHYTSEQGSTKITLNEQTLNGLPHGDYMLAVAFKRTDFVSDVYGSELENDLEVITTRFQIIDSETALGDFTPPGKPDGEIPTGNGNGGNEGETTIDDSEDAGDYKDENPDENGNFEDGQTGNGGNNSDNGQTGNGGNNSDNGQTGNGGNEETGNNGEPAETGNGNNGNTDNSGVNNGSDENPATGNGDNNDGGTSYPTIPGEVVTGSVYPTIPGDGGAVSPSGTTPAADGATPISDTVTDGAATPQTQADGAPAVAGEGGTGGDGTAPTGTTQGGDAASSASAAVVNLPSGWREGSEALLTELARDADGNILAARGMPLTLHIDKPLDSYESLTLNGEPIDAEISEGSTIVDIAPDAFDGFEDGVHTLAVAFSDETLAFPIKLTADAADTAAVVAMQDSAAPGVSLPEGVDAPTSKTLVIAIVAVIVVVGGAAVYIGMSKKRRASV